MNDLDFRDHVIESLAENRTTLLALKETMDKGMLFIHGENTALETRVTSVERKLWYGAGFTGALTLLASYLGLHRH